MNKKTALENLVFESGLTLTEFSERIGVKFSTFTDQLYNRKKRHIQYACDYGRILGINSIRGYQNGAYFEIVFKIKNVEVEVFEKL